ncbi:MAG: hypothetical protein Q7O66_23105, partial [Dehalococcoidia bacterium]|nr:hypothetical protein [Dehalococcoidia bacterium]
MAGIAHIGIGFAARGVVPKAPVVLLVVAAEAIDILWGGFFLAGMDNLEFSPWSHGLFMPVVWSLLAAVLA